MILGWRLECEDCGFVEVVEPAGEDAPRPADLGWSLSDDGWRCDDCQAERWGPLYAA